MTDKKNLVLILYSKVIWLGDLNYRIYLPEATTRSLVRNEDWSILLEHDQVITNRNPS